MKRILALVSLLTIAAACATQPSGNKDMTANANTGSAIQRGQLFRCRKRW